MAETMYAWTPIQNGGDVTTARDASGRERDVVRKRTVIAVGSKVKPDDVGGEDAFNQMVEAGSLRPYPFPEDLDPTSGESPRNYLLRKIEEARDAAAENNLDEEHRLLLASGLARPDGSVLEEAAENPTDVPKEPAKK